MTVQDLITELQNRIAHGTITPNLEVRLWDDDKDQGPIGLSADETFPILWIAPEAAC